MKQIIIIAMVLVGMTNSVWAESLADKPITPVIVLHKGHLNKAPCDISAVPILCEYRGGTLIFRYLEDLGDLEISVTNMHTGESILEFENSNDEATCIDLTEDEGDYYLEIKTTYGAWYYAYFSI